LGIGEERAVAHLPGKKDRRLKALIPIAGLIAAILPTSLSAAESDGGMIAAGLYQLCTNTDEAAKAACTMWLTGFGAGIYSAQDLAESRHEKAVTCLPDGFSGEQTKAVVLKFMSDHPEALHFSAQSVAVFALERAFPCASAGDSK
jgi:hypothetical protein